MSHLRNGGVSQHDESSSAAAHHNPHSRRNRHSHQHQKFDLTISFAAGGWFQMYHFGVCKAMLDSGFLDDLEAAGKRVRFCGSSAGALAAASLASGCRMHEEMRDFAVICAEHYRESHWHFMCMREYLNASIHRFGDRMMETPEQRQRTLAGISEGRLEIYTTTLPWLSRKCMTEFDDLDDIEEALVASCCLTPVVGFPFPLRKTGEWVCDGGMRSFQPRKGEPRTITVSPFYFTSADIHPSRPVPVWWGMYPPSKEDHLSLFTLGYNDALDYLMLSNRISTERGAKLLRTMTVSRGSRGSRGRRLMRSSSERGGIGQLAGDLFMTLAYLVILRPLAIVFIYVEMLLVVAALLLIHPCVKVYQWLMQKGSRTTADRGNSGSECDVVTDDEGDAAHVAGVGARTSGIDWRPLYETFRNFVSFRVLLRLLLSSKIPINEARLISRSRLYRAFQPLVFGGDGRVRPADTDADVDAAGGGDADDSSAPAPTSAGGSPPRRRRKFFVETFWNGMAKPWRPPHVAPWDTAIADKVAASSL